MSKNLKGGLDQYGTECFVRLILRQSEKNVGLTVTFCPQIEQ